MRQTFSFFLVDDEVDDAVDMDVVVVLSRFDVGRVEAVVDVSLVLRDEVDLDDRELELEGVLCSRSLSSSSYS